MNIPADLLPPWLYRAFAILTALAVVIVPVLVDNRVITAHVGAVIGAVIAAFAGGGHTTSLVAGRAAASAKSQPASGPQSGEAAIGPLAIVLLCVAAWFAVIGLHDVAGYVIALLLAAGIIGVAVWDTGRARAHRAASRAALAAELERIRRRLGPSNGRHW